jgi:exodeoxyribonuclease VII small subunit
MAEEKKNEEVEYTPVKDLSYEQAFEELNQIVSKLEAEDLTLEQTISLFERGQSLVQYCTSILDKTEKKIRQITGERVDDFESP